MKIVELSKKSKEELLVLLAEKRKRIDDLRFLYHTGKAKDVKELSSARKDIARILTLLQNISQQL